MLETMWGNAAVKTFRKRCIRQVRTATSSVLVHAAIADITSEALRLAEAAGCTFPEEIPGYTAYTDGSTPREWGLGFVLPGLPAELAEAFLTLGLAVDGDEVTFQGDAVLAAELSSWVEAERVHRMTPHLEKDPDAWQTCSPGTRRLAAGAKGDDVQFVQYALGCEHTDGVYSPETTQTVMLLQRMYNQRQTGVMDEDAWAALLPTTLRMAVEYGETGSTVRVLQAALLAYDWEPAVAVTGRFDQITLRGVRHLQDTYGLRASGVMGAPEWAALLGRPVRRV